MADITVTAASVTKGAGATTGSGIAGETITAGQAVYLHTDNKLYKADCNASAAAAAAVGIALNGASADQPLVYQTGGTINIGATVVAGTIYVVSATAGGIAPAADITTGWYVTIVGTATTTGAILMGLNATGAVR